MGSCRGCFSGSLQFWILVGSVLLLLICWVSCCPEDEKLSLLQFKESLHDPSGQLKTWNDSTSCCNWEGIKCHNVTKHVIHLDLHNPRVYNLARALRNLTGGVLSEIYRSSLSVDINKPDVLSSLFHLKMLESLDLSYNAFIGVGVPQQLHKLKYLQYLNLSNAGFVGKMPRELGNMSRLRYLDLSTNYYISSSSIIIDDMQMWIGNMRDLEKLLLDGVNMAQVSSDEWGKAISTMYTLRRLQMSNCQLSGPIPPSLANLTRLTHLAFDDKSENTQVFEFGWITGSTYVEKIIIRNKGSELEYVRILRLVKCLDLSNNRISGPIPEGMGSLIGLIILNISRSHISGGIPKSLGNMVQLQSLDLSQNQLSGVIPAELQLLTSLSYLDLSNNHLTGTIPQGGQLMTFDGSSFSNNSDLCGLQLYKSCSSSPMPKQKEEDASPGVDKTDEKEDTWWVVAVARSFAFWFIP